METTKRPNNQCKITSRMLKALYILTIMPNNIYRVRAHDHSEREFGENSEEAANLETLGGYPGEGHEHVHAEMAGKYGEGLNFHEHHERYGPMHELNGEFNDGHSRAEHQAIYRNNGGFNEHANMSSEMGAGIGDLHTAVLGAGYENGGAGYGAGAGDGMGYGAYGGGHGGFGGCGGHCGYGGYGGFGFEHGDGTIAGKGLLLGAGRDGLGADGCYHGGYGGYYGAHGGAYGGGIEGNRAVFGADGLLAPAHGELTFGGALHTAVDGLGHSAVRFYSGAEHDMYHAIQGTQMPANVVDFYEDTGVIDPVTGQFVGGYMHPDTFKHGKRVNHKTLEISRNMANGNGFRKVLMMHGAGGRAHGHYGEGSLPLAAAPMHSALNAVAQGTSNAFGGFQASDYANQHQIDVNLLMAREDNKEQAAQQVHNEQLKDKVLQEQDTAQANFQEANVKMAMGNIGQALEHMKKGQMANLSAQKMMVDEAVQANVKASQWAAAHGNMLAAGAFGAASACMAEAGHESAEHYAESIGLGYHHTNEFQLFGGEEHMQKARMHALKAEDMRNRERVAVLSGDEHAANALNAAAAVELAEGRAENQFGKKLSQAKTNQTVQTQMERFETLADQNVKEAIAQQDNMHKVADGNSAPFNKSIVQTLENMNLKNMAGVASNVSRAASEVLTQETADSMLDAIAVDSVVEKRLSPPPLKVALVISNADEIAKSLIKEERVKVKAEVDARKAASKLAKKVVAKKPLDTLGIVSTVPEDVEKILIERAVVRLPLKGYTPPVARTPQEKNALAAQNRLRDDLRGKVTRNKFDSPLNVIETEAGYLNLPESASEIEVDAGRAYFNEAAKAKMEAAGVNVGMLEHKINTGERKDMAAGIGYYVADVSSMKIALPTPKDPQPVLTATNGQVTVDIAEAEGLDVMKGYVKLTAWKDYLRELRPVVNQGVIVRKVTKAQAEAKKKVQVASEEANRIIARDRQMLKDVITTKKKIIINPDGQGYIELKPAYGVTEHIRVEDARKILPLTYVSGKKTVKFGQNGIDEIAGETESKEHRHEMETGVSNAYKSESKTINEIEREGLKTALLDKETNFLISKENAFSKMIVGNKEDMLRKMKKQDWKTQEWQNMEDENAGIALLKIEKDGKTAFEKHERIEERRQEQREMQSEVVEYEMRGEFAYEEKLKFYKKKYGRINLMAMTELIQLIELYMHKSIEEMHEFDFMFSTYNFVGARNILLDKVRKYGLEYLEWRNTVKKRLVTNTVLLKTLHMDFNSMDKIVKSMTGSLLNRIRAYHVLPVTAEGIVKEKVAKEYEAAQNELRQFFKKDTPEVLSFIREEILNIEHQESTEGGTADTQLREIYIPRETDNYKDGVKDLDQTVNNKYGVKDLDQVLAKVKKIVHTNKDGKKSQVCIAELPCKEAKKNAPVPKISVSVNRKECPEMGNGVSAGDKNSEIRISKVKRPECLCKLN